VGAIALVPPENAMTSSVSSAAANRSSAVAALRLRERRPLIEPDVSITIITSRGVISPVLYAAFG
jgi:hypothetical protein